MTDLFHVEKFMPVSATTPVHRGQLKYSFHAQTASQNDRFGSITLPELFNPEKAKLVEAEMNTARTVVLKQVWRQRLDYQRDLVLVIVAGGLVKTVWINKKSDKHKTLDLSKYASC